MPASSRISGRSKVSIDARIAEKIVAAARAGGRDQVGCIMLGRGEDDGKVREWLAIAAEVPGFIGFAVGRTVFWDPLVAWRAKKATREQAVAEIAGAIANSWTSSRAARPSPGRLDRIGRRLRRRS